MSGRNVLLWLLAVLVSLLMGCGRTEKAQTKEGGETAAKIMAERLPNGVVLEDGLSVAVVGFDRSPQVTRIGLAFRRVGERQWPKRMELVLSDDRGNTYQCDLLSDRRSTQGGPANPETLPCGFTWVAWTEVRMPQIAPIVRAELKITVPTGRSFHERDLGDTGREGRAIEMESRGGGGGWESLHVTTEEVRTISSALPLTNLQPPPLDFTVRPEHLVRAGKEMKLDKNLTLVFGDVEVRSVVMAPDAPTLERRACFVIPVVVRNDDYNPHPAPGGPVHIQLEDGTIYCEGSLANRPEVPAQSKLTFDLGTSLDLRLMPRILLVYLGDDRFVGFAKISESNLEQVRKIRSPALVPKQAKSK